MDFPFYSLKSPSQQILPQITWQDYKYTVQLTELFWKNPRYTDIYIPSVFTSKSNLSRNHKFYKSFIKNTVKISHSRSINVSKIKLLQVYWIRYQNLWVIVVITINTWLRTWLEMIARIDEVFCLFL